MITLMRKHHKFLMIFITILVCISFSWYWNKTDFSSIGNGAAGMFYDRSVSQVELQRNSRLLRLASQLGMRELVGSLTIGAQSESEAFENFAWNLIVLRHEGDQLGIQPTTSEIANEVKSLPAFEGEKGFDLAAYTNFADRALGPMGFTQAQIEELAADQIVLERVRKILSAGISVPEGEMRHDYDQAYAKMEVSVVRFRSEDYGKDVQVNDDQIAKYFESHKAELKAAEKRQVKFVQFGLSEEEKKLKGKARVEVLQKLADKATDFTDALQAKGANFDQVAAKFQLTPKETGEFTLAKPDPLLAEPPALAAAAFSLTKEAPNSEATQAKDGFVILRLMKVEPARPLTPEEARPQIVEALKKEAGQQGLAMMANATASKLRESLKNGQSPADAASAAGLKAEKLPSFALVDTPPGVTPAPKPKKNDESPDMDIIKQTASTLRPGSVSDYVHSPQGGLIVILEKREQITAAEFEKARPLLEEQTVKGKGQVVFYQWLRERRHAAGIEEKATKSPAAG